MSISANQFLQNWIPYKLYIEKDEAYCHWLDLKNKQLVEPFFADTISISRDNRFFKCVSKLEMLQEWSTKIPWVQPTAFIFHVSRCGSTLLSQLLSTDEKNIVLSEVPFFDELLRLHLQNEQFSSDEMDKILQQAIRFYGQKRSGKKEHLFIKADCWHIFFYERLRKLYPSVPFFLLYRSPDEVLQSQLKKKGMQAVPGVVEPEIMGLKLEEGDVAIFDHGLYFSRVLEKIMEKFIEVNEKDSNSFLLNYKEGSAAWLKSIASHCGLSFDESVTEKMKERSLYHGKYPDEKFQEEIVTGSPAYLSTCIGYYSVLEESRSAIID